MKKLLFLLLVPALCFGQYTSIPDKNFEQILIRLGYDDNLWPDGKVPTNKIDKVKKL